MIDALIAGRIFGVPEQRTARNGSAYATAKIRVPMKDGESTFVNVVAFRDSARAALLALSDGDSAAIAGELKASAYLAKDGMPKASLDLTAHQVLTEYAVQRKRKLFADAAKPLPQDFDDSLDGIGGGA